MSTDIPRSLFDYFVVIEDTRDEKKRRHFLAGMASTLPVVPVWIGASLALFSTSALGVVAGRKLLGLIPLHRIHQISGVFFLGLAAFALTTVF